MGHTVVYSTPNPLLFSGRVLLQTGEGRYRIVDGSITNCRLPHPDWRIIAHSINLDDEKASTSNAFFEFLGIPIFYLPYLHHPANDTGRASGLLTPVISNGSSIRGYTLGEQAYWAINRSMDMVVGAEYFSKRGWAPNGDFRYKGPGLDHLIARWNALLDRGIEEEIGNTWPARGVIRPAQSRSVGYELVNQGGVDVTVLGRKDFIAPNPCRRRHGISVELRVPAGLRRQLLAGHQLPGCQRRGVDAQCTTDWCRRSGSTDFNPSPAPHNGDEVKILRLPLLRYDVLDRPLGSSLLYWGLGSSIGYPEPLRAVLPLAQRGPRGFLSASLHAAHSRRMELRSRSGAARHLVHHQPDSQSHRPIHDDPDDQPRSAEPHGS